MVIRKTEIDFYLQKKIQKETAEMKTEKSIYSGNAFLVQG